MTDEQRRLAIQLGRCRFLPGSHDKRFARDMLSRAQIADSDPLSEKQDAELRRLCHRYRKQIAGLARIYGTDPDSAG